MIRLWLTRNSSVPMREQLRAQLMLGILSRRLRPGERLPSVRELARRLRIHPNTVSAVYQDLSVGGWVQSCQGSGVYITEADSGDHGDSLAGFVEMWVEASRQRGFSIPALISELERLRQQQLGRRRFLVIDPDLEFARILATEIGESLGQPVEWATCSQEGRVILQEATDVFVNTGHVSAVAPFLADASFRTIRVKSMQDVLTGQQRPSVSALIAVVSRSPFLLSWAATLLSALGFPSESVLLRNPDLPDWQEGLGVCDIVAADICAAAELAKAVKPIVFRIVAEDSLAELRAIVTA